MRFSRKLSNDWHDDLAPPHRERLLVFRIHFSKSHLESFSSKLDHFISSSRFDKEGTASYQGESCGPLPLCSPIAPTQSQRALSTAIRSSGRRLLPLAEVGHRRQRRWHFLAAQIVHKTIAAVECTPLYLAAIVSRGAPPKTSRKLACVESLFFTPLRTTPPITLPSPDEPTPPNFLRNQQALLGLAGLVGGVHPAQLQRQPRGSSAHFPIVLDDDEDRRSKSSRIPADQPSLSRRPYLSPVDPSQLPQPGSEDILTTLIRQKNIFPVIESLLRLVSTSTPAAPATHYSVRTGWEKTPPGGAPPLKRRKLNNVPAGAADWDVPYPFQAGQGPADYHAQWERERVRTLLTDLVRLVQSATEKAALKAYVEKREKKRQWDQEVKVWGHYRPATLTYGLPKRPPPNPSDPSQTPEASSAAGRSAAGKASEKSIALPLQPTTPFDQLVASLMSASQQQQANSSSSAQVPASESSSPSPDFANWLSLLSSCALGDANIAQINTIHLHDTHNTGQPPNGPFPSSTASVQALAQPAGTEPIPDFLIDPELLALSPLTSASGLIQPPALAAPVACTDVQDVGLPTPASTGINSPVASTSSLPDMSPCPPTPEWAWAFSEPDVAGAMAESFTELDAAMVMNTEISAGEQALDPMADKHAVPGEVVVSPSTAAPEATPTPPETTNIQMSARSGPPNPITTSVFPEQPPAASQPSLQPPTAASVHAYTQTSPSAAPHAHFHTGTQPSSMRGTASPLRSATNVQARSMSATTAVDPKVARSALLARVRALRSGLAAELERTKIELWETTMEQGVLTKLAKD